MIHVILVRLLCPTHLSGHGVVFLDGGEEVVVAGGHDARRLLQDTLQKERKTSLGF